MGGFAIGTTEFATMSLLPYMAAGLHITEPTAGHVISAYALGVVIGAPVLAVLSARLTRRNLLLMLMAVFVVGNGLSALAPTYGWMLAFRFMSGVPHGAYFGIASLAAASLVPPNRRAHAVSRVLMGVMVATLLGIPLANWLGQALGWRWSFGLVTAQGLLTVLLIALLAPKDKPDIHASRLRELGALRSKQVWLTLGMGAIGFGGFFAVYSYLASTLMEVTHVSPGMVPVVLAVLGAGMTIGSFLVPLAADRALMPTAGGLLLWAALAMALFPFTASNIWLVSIDVFMIGLSGAMGVVLQTRLMDVAQNAQRLAAALNHSAFNTANALGPWLGGLVIAHGFGWTSTGWVGFALALAGFGIWCVSVWTDSPSKAVPEAVQPIP